MSPANGNQLLIDYGDQAFYCYSCDRWFNTALGALSHAGTAQTHVGEWWERCQWLFVSATARGQHCAMSSQHHICEDCDKDFDSAVDLHNHIADHHLPPVRYTGRPPPPPTRYHDPTLTYYVVPRVNSVQPFRHNQQVQQPIP